MRVNSITNVLNDSQKNMVGRFKILLTSGPIVLRENLND